MNGTVSIQTEWEIYLAYLVEKGYVPFKEHENCRRTYGVGGSCVSWCRDHKVKVMPMP